MGTIINPHTHELTVCDWWLNFTSDVKMKMANDPSMKRYRRAVDQELLKFHARMEINYDEPYSDHERIIGYLVFENSEQACAFLLAWS
jgi:hypothetical protein